jgi:hydrogenase/urease accessory protein HupE
MRSFAPIALLLLLGYAAGRADAHEVRPGYLELRQSGPEIFEVLWKVPARGDLRLALYAKLPASCEQDAPSVRIHARGAVTERWRVTCSGGITGQTIAIDGLDATFTDVLVRIDRRDGTTQVARLTPDIPAFVVEATPGLLRVAGTYLHLGVEHILLGIDHLLFVLALLILVDGRRRLIGTVTAFTVAHSLTLAAATLGLVHLSQQPVEAVIALSIVFVAVEIAHGPQGRSGWTRRWPWLVAFVFGLLHGFGFAGALREMGLPDQAIPLALLSFNVGVELGQLLFIAVVLALAAVARRVPLPRLGSGWRLAPYGIGGVAAYWMIERVAGFVIPR